MTKSQKIRRDKKIFLKDKYREKRKKDLLKGFEKYKNDVRKLHPDAEFKYIAIYQLINKRNQRPKPKYSELIQYLLTKPDSFGKNLGVFDNNVFEIPESFSLVENYKETSSFIGKLFNALYNESFDSILIDYKKCTNIDVGASMCMDIILSDFINYYQQAVKNGYKIKVNEIKPINYERKEIQKVLFSIGAFRNIKGIKIHYANVIDFPIIIGSKKNKNLSTQREVDITKTVDYIVECLSKLGKHLTGLAETNLYKVIGEVIINADEHSNTSNRYSIGYFEKTSSENQTFGIFNLAILNFGNTIYETFGVNECNNIHVLDQMKNLSKKYSSKKFFLPAEFEEETLWTLYALQDGVSRMPDWKRGNGAIRFIESFFELKGSNGNDKISKMLIISGRTRIIFDGKYKIVSTKRGKDNKIYKMMTFNNTGNIEDKPDSNYVKYEKNYFPGTLISAKIRIDLENTENINYGYNN